MHDEARIAGEGATRRRVVSTVKKEMTLFLNLRLRNNGDNGLQHVFELLTVMAVGPTQHDR